MLPSNLTVGAIVVAVSAMTAISPTLATPTLTKTLAKTMAKATGGAAYPSQSSSLGGHSLEVGTLEASSLGASRLDSRSSRVAQLNPTVEITRFYKEILGRTPDAAGLNFHVNRARQGRSLGLIEQDLLNSPEGRRMSALLASDPYAGEVIRIFRDEVRRDPDRASLAHYVREMDKKNQTSAMIRQAIRNTPEAQTKRQIIARYQGVYGRDIDDALLERYYNEVATRRKTLDDLSREFMTANRPTPTPTPTPQPSPSPTPLTPRPPVPDSAGISGNAYYVVIPQSSGGNLTDIRTSMVRLGTPSASIQIRDQPRGQHIALGPFRERRLANDWNNYLRNNGFDARVYYGRY